MPGIDGMPPMGDVGGCSRKDFLKGAGFVGLSGFLAACHRQANKGSDGMPRSADYGRREPSPLSIELTDEERGEIICKYFLLKLALCCICLTIDMSLRRIET